MRKLMILALMGIALSSNLAKAQKIYDFTSVQTQPSFKGGMSAFYNYLSKEIKYPPVAKKNNTQGRVFLSFTVEKDGKLDDVAVVKGLTKETNLEAIRVLKNSPNWNPGKLDGKLVRVKYHIAVNFSLSPEGSQKKASVLSPSQRIPDFPGGEAKLYAFLAKSIKYPAQAKKDNIQGKVLLSFYIEKDGKISDARVTKGVSKELNEEALRVIKTSPR